MVVSNMLMRRESGFRSQARTVESEVEAAQTVPMPLRFGRLFKAT